MYDLAVRYAALHLVDVPLQLVQRGLRGLPQLVLPVQLAEPGPAVWGLIHIVV
jgi:hypothetical protein